jgi:hypothetical protein
MFRWIKRAVLAALIVALIVAAPIVWVEQRCTTTLVAAKRPAPLVSDAGYVRRESDSYLSFPEWHIVYAYDDLAAVLRRGTESDYAYARQITGFWRNLGELNRVVSARERTGTDTKVMLYTIGWSFTAELGAKGAYENTLGRLFEWLRGPGKTNEDAFIAADMQRYSAFLRQTPWYEYPFASRLVSFWRNTPFDGAHRARAVERRAVLTGEYGVKAVYGGVIGFASQSAYGPADLVIHTVVSGLTPADVKAVPRITIVRDLGDGRVLIRTPRYQAYTDVIVGLARRGREIVEIAGNRRILVTVLAPSTALPTVPDTTVLFEAPTQSQPDRRRVGLDASVPRLATTIKTLEAAGVTIEHLYDY